MSRSRIAINENSVTVPAQGDEGPQYLLVFIFGQVDSPCPSPASLTPSTSVTNLASLGKSSAEKTAAGGLKTLSDGSVIIPIRVECPETPMEVETEPPEGPAPRHLSELELKVMSGALTRWRKEVEEDIAALDKALQVSSKISPYFYVHRYSFL